MYQSGKNALFIQFKSRMTANDVQCSRGLDYLESLGHHVVTHRLDNRLYIDVNGHTVGILLQCRSCKYFFTWDARKIHASQVRCPGCNQVEKTH